MDLVVVFPAGFRHRRGIDPAMDDLHAFGALPTLKWRGRETVYPRYQDQQLRISYEMKRSTYLHTPEYMPTMRAFWNVDERRWRGLCWSVCAREDIPLDSNSRRWPANGRQCCSQRRIARDIVSIPMGIPVTFSSLTPAIS